MSTKTEKATTRVKKIKTCITIVDDKNVANTTLTKGVLAQNVIQHLYPLINTNKMVSVNNGKKINLDASFNIEKSINEKYTHISISDGDKVIKQIIVSPITLPNYSKKEV